ncbi:MAG: DegT/DnrJ/EryC1/StrS family aminotransferase [Candidatus Sericytochromatia bacterium]
MSDRLALDPATSAVSRFERQLAEAFGARHAVAVEQPASSLALACRTVGLGAGDVLWAAPNGRSAAAEVARACGATLDFVDVDPLTGALSTRALTEKLHHAERHGRLPKVLIAYHEAGQPCDLAGLNHLGNLYGYFLVEEATEALGARYGETWVGDCRYGDVVVFGTAVTTNRDDWAATLRQLAASAPMSEAQAARAAQGLEALEESLARKEALAARYEAALPEVMRAWRNPDHRSALPSYPVRLTAEVGQAAPAPLHLGLGFEAGDFPEAERYAAETRYLPLDVDMTDAAQDEVIARVRSAFR